MPAEPPEKPVGNVYEMSANESPSQGVVMAVASQTDAAPVPSFGNDNTVENPESRGTDTATNGTGSEQHQSGAEDYKAGTLDPLYSVIDPDALDALFESLAEDSRDSSGCVQFTYHGLQVTVYSNRQIQVTPV